MTFSFSQIGADQLDWERIDNNEVTIFQSREWLDYYRNAKIGFVIFLVTHLGREVGFMLLAARKILFMKHWGSPLPGTNTGFGGFIPFKDRGSLDTLDSEMLYKIYRFFFDYSKTKADYLSIEDIRLMGVHFPSPIDARLKITLRSHYFLDLDNSWEDIFRSFKEKSCRYEYRKGLKNGLSVRFVHNGDRILDTHYEHLENVFKRKGLVPGLSKKRLHDLYNALGPRHMLIAACVDPEGIPVASCTVVYNQNYAFLTTAACEDKWLGKGANELLMVEAIKEIKCRGVRRMEFGGGMRYKEKYGTTTNEIPLLEYSAKWNIDYAKLKTIYKKIRKNKLVQYFQKMRSQ